MSKHIIVLIAFYAVSSLVSCEKSNAENIESLKKATLDGENTLETIFNGIAGPNGSVSWYNPPENPVNTNFKMIGAKVQNKTVTADYILLIDTSDMSAAIQSVSFNGKTIHYNQFGIPDDMNASFELTELILKSALGLQGE
jgi:hypothetical protein